MLREIVEYGKRQHGPKAEQGFLPKTVRWLLTFSSAGKYLGVVPLAEGPRSKGREFPKSPHLKFSGDTPMRQFLVDTAEYALMYGSVRQTDKLKIKHEYFLNLLREAASAEPILAKVADAIANDSVRAGICRDLEQQKAKPSDSVTFAEMRDGQPRIIVEQDTWHNWWRSSFRALFEKKGDAGKKGVIPVKASQVRCFITGDLVEPCPTHPKIKGLGGDVGGLVETTLIGFNKDAFCSYGLEQSANAAVGSQAAEEYAAALNKLIANQSHRLAGTKVVYWYVGDKLPEKEEDPVAELFGGMDFGGAEVENDPEAQPVNPKTAQAQATSRAGELLDAIRSGQRPELRNCQYRALTLSGNAGRVVVRDWMQGQFEELVKNVAAWFEDLRLMNLAGVDPIYSPTLEQMATCFLPPRGKTQKYTDWVKSVGKEREALWQCAVRGPQFPIPALLAGRVALAHNTHILNHRFIATNRDSSPRESQDKSYQPSLLYTRMALLKAYLNRYARAQNQGDYQVFPNLNVNHPRAAYQCGRLMAVLEMIQTEAQGEIGATIAQTHYATASARPIAALPRLETLTQHHLPKIKPPRLRNEYQRLLTEINGRIKDTIPRTFDLEDQCLFHLGYYHQRGFQPYAEPPRRHKTMNNGELVRSKSEVIVSNLLSLLGFKFEYEVELRINDHILLHPDFTIREKDNRFGKPIYIEHLGMMDNFTYRADWEDRQKLLMNAGILPLADGGGENGVLVTTEEKNGTINCEELVKTLKEIQG